MNGQFEKSAKFLDANKGRGIRKSNLQKGQRKIIFW